jgi:hypothetical protein
LIRIKGAFPSTFFKVPVKASSLISGISLTKSLPT